MHHLTLTVALVLALASADASRPNPEGGDVYWGVNCTAATTNTTISLTQEDSVTCAGGLRAGCCDPTFRDILHNGPCAMPTSE
ncbi:hypothetical protein Q5752_002720 [Cryptotrichosporon argae]